MPGPLVQMPPGLSQVFDVKYDAQGKVSQMTLRPEWAAFWSSLQQVSFNASRNGSSAARPTAETIGRYEGMPFLDRTLGYPVYLLHASSNVWVRYDGTVV
jgi:hypothetical protein